MYCRYCTIWQFIIIESPFIHPLCPATELISTSIVFVNIVLSIIITCSLTYVLQYRDVRSVRESTSPWTNLSLLLSSISLNSGSLTTSKGPFPTPAEKHVWRILYIEWKKHRRRRRRAEISIAHLLYSLYPVHCYSQRQDWKRPRDNRSQTCALHLWQTLQTARFCHVYGGEISTLLMFQLLGPGRGYCTVA